MAKVGTRGRGRGKTKTGRSKMSGAKKLAIAARKARLEDLCNPKKKK